MSRQKLAVILGAGASHDCCPLAKGAILDRAWQPPTVVNMFDSGAFDRVLLEHEEAYALFSPVRTRMVSGWTLEQALKEQVESASENTRRLLAYVPIALNDFFHRVSKDFVAEAVNYTTLVSRTVIPQLTTAFVTVNYDTLLERSLRRWTDKAIRFKEDYVNGDDWTLIKLHGSVGWAWPWHQNAEHRLARSAVRHYALPDRDMAAIQINIRENLLSERDIFYPALALPVPGKGDFICPPSHVEVMRQFLGDCQSFLFVGFSGRDTDVLDCLKASLRAGVLYSMAIVTAARDYQEVKERILAGVPQLQGALSIERGAADGFSDFLARGDLDDFLDLVIRGRPSVSR